MMKIGITYTGPHGTGSDEKQQNYINWINAGDTNGFEVVTLFPEDGIPELEGFAGIIFSGGIDIQPSLYGLSETYPNAPAEFNHLRDEFETLLFEKTQDYQLPVLGICRGMQLVNVLSGGTLKQDLGSEGNEKHRAIPSDKKHQATVESGTILSAIIDGGLSGDRLVNGVDRSNGNLRITINSAHHQVVDKVAGDLRISCYSADGEPEALERRRPEGRPFLLCVQWHPERMFRFGLENEPASAGIRDRFLEETKQHSKVHENS